MKTQLLVSSVLVQMLAVGQTSIGQPRCPEFKELAIANAVPNQLHQVEAAISTAVANGKYVCAEVLIDSIAARLALHGRIRDSEAFAARSLDLLRKNVDSDDPMLLRPLLVLAIARLEQGKLGKAEQAFQQMLQVRAERPEQRAQVHVVGGALRQKQGKWKEAESEYLLAYEEWNRLRKTADADSAAILSCLGDLYNTAGRFKEASQVLDRALDVLAIAENALPLDRIKLLNSRAVAHARQGEWTEAQEKLRLAVASAESAGISDSAGLRSVFDNYAITLRKNHHKKVARAIERRASTLPRDPGARAVVDVDELSKGLRAR